MLTPMNNGLDGVSTDDLGLAEVTGIKTHEGLFRAPSLKNIAVRGPHMHDGRFETLEEVIEHYSTGVQPHHNLDRKLKSADGSPRKLNLTERQKTALVAFLETLTDEAFLRDEKFSDPFATK